MRILDSREAHLLVEVGPDQRVWPQPVQRAVRGPGHQRNRHQIPLTRVTSSVYFRKEKSRNSISC